MNLGYLNLLVELRSRLLLIEELVSNYLDSDTNYVDKIRLVYYINILSLYNIIIYKNF